MKPLQTVKDMLVCPSVYTEHTLEHSRDTEANFIITFFCYLGICAEVQR